jgi:hypothetical protein
MPGLVRVRALSLAAVAAALVVPSVASADITGSVKTPWGAPLISESVEVRDSAGRLADFATTDANGNWRSTTSDLGGTTPPYTAKVTSFDRCDTTGNSSREATVPIAGDGVSDANVVLDLLEFCNANTSGVEGSALIDAPAHQIISPPGGTATLQVLAPSSATNVTVALQDGTPIGNNPTDTTVPVTLPSAPYNGPFIITYLSSDGTSQISFVAGTLIVAVAGPPAPAGGNLDLEAIVDVSGSMSGTDPKYRRKDAVKLLLDLSTKGDKLGAVGFDDSYKPIFDLTSITGDAVIRNLKTIADQKIVNAGGTNYNVGFDEAYKALTGPNVNQARPKGAIFLTDGGHNSGAYNNGHLHFAINPSGHTWPVCVVQLGPSSSFQQVDVDRLKRIATETGGQYVQTPNDDQLAGLYFSCLGRTTGAKTVLNKTFKFRQGQTRRAKERLPKKKLPSVTFFVNWGDGKYELQLKDPRGKIHTRRRPGRGATFGQGSTYAFYRIRRPEGGIWQVIVKAVSLTDPTDTANVKITVIPQKKN